MSREQLRVLELSVTVARLKGYKITIRFLTFHISFTYNHHPSERNRNFNRSQKLFYPTRRDFIYSLRSPPTAWALNYMARRS